MHRIGRSVVLGALGALALCWPPYRLVEGRGKPPASPLFDAAVADTRLGQLRPHLDPGSRVRYLVPSADQGIETAHAYLAQYALAPAIVVPVMLRKCSAAFDCGLSAPGLFATDLRDAELFQTLAHNYGLRPIIVEPGAVLLGRGQ